VFSFGDGACTDKMGEFAGSGAEGLLCSQAGIPPQAASKKFLDAYKKRFNIDPILYGTLHVRRRKPADRGDEESRLGRPGEISARSGRNRFRRRDGQDFFSMKKATAKTPK